MPAPVNPALIFPLADLGLCDLLPYTQGTDGKWTAASSGAFSGGAVSLLGYLDSVAVAVSQQLMEALSVDSAYMNKIPTIIDSMAVVTENVARSQSATDRPFTALIVANYAFVRLRVAFKRKGPYWDLYTMYGAWSRYTGGSVAGIGVQKAGMTLEQVDTSYTAVDGTTGIAPFSIARVNA